MVNYTRGQVRSGEEACRHAHGIPIIDLAQSVHHGVPQETGPTLFIKLLWDKQLTDIKPAHMMADLPYSISYHEVSG